MPETYDVGDLVRLGAAFTKSGVATDPTTLTLKIRTPGGVTTTYTYPTDAQLSRDGPGLYHLELALGASGTWVYRWAGTGAAQAAEEGEVNVRASNFP
jgi:hypothetical protein